MNKIIVDKEELIIDVIENICLDCYNTSKIILKGSNKNVDIILNDNSSLQLFWFIEKPVGRSKIKIIQKNNSKLFYRSSFESDQDVFISLINEIIGNNNYSDIKIRCISKDNCINLDVLASVLENTKDNEVIEDLKGINMGGLVVIEPNIEINTNEVMANHLMSIGNIDQNCLLSLMRKGISEDKAIELILNGFLQSIYK